jgi:alpha-L-rhamnosidase
MTPYGLAECAWTLDKEQIEVAVVIPPNTTARVTLPGGSEQTLVLGSGTHRWRYPYQVPKHPVRSLESTLGELIDDPEAWNAIVRTIRLRLSGLERHLDISNLLLQNSDLTLEQMLPLLPQADTLRPVLAAVLTALAHPSVEGTSSVQSNKEELTKRSCKFSQPKEGKP